MTDTNIDAVCNQRRLAQLYNIPPTRLEIISPYGGAFSAFDLNMRRKAEVLKYANNASNSKTNNLTKKEQLALLARGSAKLSQATLKANEVLNCPNLASILTPTYYSNVPGPVMLLYDDESVPLYNYSTNVDSYAQLPVITPGPFYLAPLSNIVLSNDTSGQIFAQIFTNLADIERNTYSINIPIGINVSGTIASLAGGTGITFTLTALRLAQYFNGSVIAVNTFSLPTLYLSLDLSGQTAGDNFSASNIYIGNATFSSWQIYGAPGYVYQWYASAHISYAGTATIGTNIILQTVVATTSLGQGIVLSDGEATTRCAVVGRSGGVNVGIIVTKL